MNSFNFNKTDYVIYTDGACLGNPGKGGWAALIFFEDKKKVLSGSDFSTTNNRMELMAVIKPLEILNSKSRVQIFSDSRYVTDGISKWIKKWKENNWVLANKKPVKNKDLWKRLDSLTQSFSIEWNWVKAHSLDIYNNEVDKIARTEAEKISK